MNIFHLVYSSHASAEFKDSSIQDILKVARENNPKHGLTGLLVYRSRTFIQLLEGSEKEVKSLYFRILSDPRHDQVKNLIEAKSDQRIFSDWGMAYVDEKTVQGTPIALFELFDTVIQNNNTDKNVIIPILRKFLGVLGPSK